MNYTLYLCDKYGQTYAYPCESLDDAVELYRWYNSFKRVVNEYFDKTYHDDQSVEVYIVDDQFTLVTYEGETLYKSFQPNGDE